MAGALSSRYGSDRQRVFVLVDEDCAKGVFFTWEAAESFADENQYSLEKLMEYETSSDYPDHLHLMAAKWDNEWIFQGEWSRRTPSWPKPPKRIRLDHFHARGNAFHLFRQREFDWEEDLLLRINPMAPDNALESRAPTPSALPHEGPHWQPKVAPLKPLQPIQEPTQPDTVKIPEPKETPPAEDAVKESVVLPKTVQKTEINTDYSQLADSLVVDNPDEPRPAAQTSRKLPRILRDKAILDQKPDEVLKPREIPEPEPVESGPVADLSPPQENKAPEKVVPDIPKSKSEQDSELVLEIPKEEDKPKPVIQPRIAEGKLKLRSGHESSPQIEQPSEEPPDPSQKNKDPRISFKKRPGLKLKSKSAPTPIPSFKPTPVLDINPSGKSSVELAHSDPSAMAGKKPVEPEYVDKLRRILSIKLIFTIIAVILGWAGGIFWVLRPEPTAESIVAEVITLNRARKIVIEPQMVFYQLEVDPVHQERYIQNLNLEPISESEPIMIPTYHALDTWEKPNMFIRPPYADVEVEEWWNLRKREVKYGFRKEWEDGSILILDFESDTIVGWAKAKLLPEILN